MTRGDEGGDKVVIEASEVSEVSKVSEVSQVLKIVEREASRQGSK